MSHAMRVLSAKETKIYLKRDIKHFERNTSRNTVDKERRVMKICPPIFSARDVLTVSLTGQTVTKRVSLFHSRPATNLDRRNIRN